MLRLCLLVLSLLAGAAPPPALAQEAKIFTGEAWMQARLGTMVREGRKIIDLEQALLKLFHDTDVQGSGVTAGDHERLDVIALAKARAREVARTLERDLDGDGRITQAEIEAVVGPEARQFIYVQGVRIRPTAEQVRQITEQLVARALIDDTDKDGVVSFSELQAAATAKVRTQVLSGASRLLRVPMLLDADGDGKVSIGEYERTMRSQLKLLDQNGDGIVSAQEAAAFRSLTSAAESLERTAFRREQEAQRLGELIGRCAFPKARVDDEVHLVGAYTGLGLSDVTIGGGELDVAAAEVAIEQGSAPILLVLTSYDAVVWRFTGAVGRVRSVVVQSIKGSVGKTSRSGVVGIEKARVHFAPTTDCIRYFAQAADSQGKRAAGRLQMLVGRAATGVIGAHGIARVHLPGGRLEVSGRITGGQMAAKSGPGAEIWQALDVYAPGGLVTFEVSQIVAALPVRRAEVLPHIAGVAQLVESGALQVAGGVKPFDLTGKAATAKGGSKLIGHPKEFRIVGPMRFPSGLTSAHGLKFYLQRGVPMPAGEAGYSCVVSEETGERVGGSGRC